MISRRILRIKVLQTIYSYYQGGDLDIAKSEKELNYSIQRSYDLYFFLMQLGIEVVDYAQNRIEAAKQKLLPTENDLNPNLRFVNNKLIQQFRENTNLAEHIQKNKLSWNNNPELIKRLYKDLSESEQFIEYMSADKSSYDLDKKIIAFFYEQIVCECDLLYQTLETLSIYWIDSVEFIISMVLRSISKFKIGYEASYPLLPMFKNPEDKAFGIKLFRGTIAKNEQYRQIISENTKNWDIERIAFFDILILETAICEIEQFPEVPLKVTFNEYIEIAKNYSTSKSCVFINGVLDKIVNILREQKKINKVANIPTDDNENE
ncbi:MAG: transcription antitermination factor NusB [Bacteroidales bacterium]|nr:transcription antitermination factor NusB [Bacteroidales bacterium]